MRLHHVGVAVPDIPRAAADFVAQFGYRAVSEVIHDPLQTAFVQFFRLGEEKTLLELIAPDGPDSTLSAAATRRRGGLHHMCYAVQDIAAACAKLGALRMVVIHEPVPAVAFPGRRIAWLMGQNHVLTELVEEGIDAWTKPRNE